MKLLLQNWKLPSYDLELKTSNIFPFIVRLFHIRQRPIIDQSNKCRNFTFYDLKNINYTRFLHQQSSLISNLYTRFESSNWNAIRF